MRSVSSPWLATSLLALLCGATAVASAAEPAPLLALVDAAPAMDAADATRVAWGPDGETLVVSGPGRAPAPVSLPAVSVERDDVILHTAEGDERLTRGEDRFFDPQLSPDGRTVAFVGLVSGVHVMDLATRRVTHPGAGTAPTWTPDSRWILFERTADDGANLTGSELVAHRPADDRTLDLTATPDAHERRPAVSPDGTRVAYLCDGAVVVARLVEGAR